MTAIKVEQSRANVVVLDELGLHARPAARLARLAQQYVAEVTITSGSTKADAKSILEILSLAAGPRTQLSVCCTGVDAPEALAAICTLFASAGLQEG